jgi:DNA primase
VILTNTQKLNLLQKYLGKADHAGGIQVAFHCPVCNDSRLEKKKLAVRISDGWYHCWVCGLSGKSFYTLLKKLAPQSLADPALAEVLERSPDFQQVVPVEKIDKVELPTDLHLVGLNETSDPDIAAVRRYLENRGLTKSDMLRWRISATKQGSFKRRAIIPSFDSEGEANYFVARKIDDSTFKYNNCKRPKTEIVFNEVDIDWSKPVTLVEGVFDAINCPENTIPVLGSSLPKDSELFRKLWQHSCQVTVAFDPDLKAKSHKVCNDLSNVGLDVYQVWAPDGRDFGSMKKDEVIAILKTARPWAKEERLFFKIQNINSGSLF